MAVKRTSQPLNIGASIDLVDGTPASTTVTLPLSSLDREVFVVTDVQMDAERLNAQVAPGFAVLSASVNKTKETVIRINDPNCVASMAISLETTALGHVYEAHRNPDEASTGVQPDYLTIISTPDFELAGSFVTTAGGAGNRAVSCRITGYRAVATADVYAALVTEELNQ